jgi:hypothetical protein
MDPIKEIETRLTKYPGVVYQSADDHISVPAGGPDGFGVRLDLDGPNFIVSFDGWHETFADVEEALNCFAMGLTGACRLEVEFRGRMARRWAVQWLNDGSWVTDSEVGLLLFPLWRRKQIVYRQNHLPPRAP